MGKDAKPAKKRTISEKSRAARRAVSPTIDLDKSLKDIPTKDASTPKIKTAKPHVLASQSPGIRKKSGKPMKRQQRERHLKALERASDVLDKMEIKVQKSVGREKKVNERKKGWEELDGEKKKKKGKNVFAALEDDDGEVDAAKEREWVSDEEMPEVGGAEEQAMEPAVAAEPKEPQQVRVPGSIFQAPVDDDEML